MPKKIPREGTPEAHDELKGFDIHINEFGEIISTLPIDQLNNFLDDRVQDKKLASRIADQRDEQE